MNQAARQVKKIENKIDGSSCNDSALIPELWPRCFQIVSMGIRRSQIRSEGSPPFINKG